VSVLVEAGAEAVAVESVELPSLEQESSPYVASPGR
jgi:hypothetical protein